MTLHRALLASAVVSGLLAWCTPLRAQNAVDSLFSQWNRPNSPGCAVAVAQSGQTRIARAYGMADLEGRIALSPESVFDAGSLAKQFTAAALVLLADEGKLSLDDDIRKHIPELPDYGRPVSIRQLLHHTGGIRDYVGLLQLAGVRLEDRATVEEQLSMVARQRALNFAPGGEHRYSNSGYLLAATIVQRVSGQPFGLFLRERIFEPLGMSQTRYARGTQVPVQGKAGAYSPEGGGAYRPDLPAWEQLGDGGVLTTVADLLRWADNFITATVGGSSLVRQMQAPGTLAGGDTLSYALGLYLGAHRGLKVVSHSGQWGGYRAELLRVPAERLAVAILCNAGDASPARLARRVADEFITPRDTAHALVPPRTASVPRSPRRITVAEMRGAAGTYRNPDTGSLRVLEVEGGRLWVRAFGGRFELRSVGQGEFEMAEGPFALLFRLEGDGVGNRRRLLQIAPDAPAAFDRVELANPSRAQLREYAGTFRSEELGAEHRLEVADGALLLHIPRMPAVALRPLERDHFTAEGFSLPEYGRGAITLHFERGTRGQITAMRLGFSEFQRLHFHRVGAP